MEVKSSNWELTIVDVVPTRDLNCLSVADIDGDGVAEVVVGGQGGMYWYRTGTGEHGLITDLDCHCACPVQDIDGDGLPEIVVGDFQQTAIHCYKPVDGVDRPWKRFDVDPEFPGGAHDIIFADVDGDGGLELVAVAMYTSTPGIFIYRPPAELGSPWERFTVQEGVSGDGLDAADVDGDGVMEIAQGPYLWKAAGEGPFRGPWEMAQIAPSFREMCRDRFFDVNGDGKRDLVIGEAEYPNGRFSWFENCGDNRWVEHPIDRRISYGHSLEVVREGSDVRIFIAEMAKGGWSPEYNWDAREMFYTSGDGGLTWANKVVCRGAGTHEARLFDIDLDGEQEIIGKECYEHKLMFWKRVRRPPNLSRFRHSFIDRQKRGNSTDIFSLDLDCDGLEDVITGRFWYRAPNWRRYEIPGVEQILNSYDIDGDGQPELIGMAVDPVGGRGLNANLCWLKAIDPQKGIWERYQIGSGSGDWPHGTVVAPLLPGGRIGLVACYHGGSPPEIFAMPDDPLEGRWTREVIADIPYREEVLAHDMTGNGLLDVVCGPWWMENTGGGGFITHKICDLNFEVARVVVTDVDGDGKKDLVVTGEDVDWDERRASFAPVAWLRNPGDPRSAPWEPTLIDTLRSPHSIAAHDLDHDGENELVVGEHDPFWAHRSRSRLAVYKKADPAGKTWRRYIVDDRFEHHDGTKIIDLGESREGIISTGWVDNQFVNLWEKI